MAVSDEERIDVLAAWPLYSASVRMICALRPYVTVRPDPSFL